jgi:hypothetical protein
VSGSPLEAEDAEKAGLGKKEHPILQIAVTPFLAQMKNVLALAGLGSRALAYLQLVSRTRR